MAKPYAHHASLKAITDHLDRLGENASVELTDLPGRFRVRYSISECWPVSIIIATAGRLPVLIKNLETLVEKTQYSEYEIIVADNSRGEEVRAFLKDWSWRGRSPTYLDWRNRPFNYSAINNAAARTSSSPLLLFLNDDTEVISPDWLCSMVELAARPAVGAVGAKLLYPDGRLQHAGVTLGVYNCCANSFQGAQPEGTYYNFADVIRNVSAVTGACLLTRADVFWSVGGFDEHRFPIAFNDVDLCLKIGAAGYRIIYMPDAILYHHEAYSKDWHELTPATVEVNCLLDRWKTLIENDPFYSPRLSRERTDFSVL
jgi:GT2 family glycosyltransferase